MHRHPVDEDHRTLSPVIILHLFELADRYRRKNGAVDPLPQNQLTVFSDDEINVGTFSGAHQFFIEQSLICLIGYRG